MSDVEQVERRLAELADRVKSAHDRGIAGYEQAVDAYFAIGQTLVEARELFGRNDKAYGQWLAAQNFPFSAQWAGVLRDGAKYEGAVRSVVASQLASTGSMNFDRAVRDARAALNPAKPKKPVVVDESTSEEAKPAIKADVFAQDPHGPADVGEATPPAEGDGKAACVPGDRDTQETGSSRSGRTDGDSDESAGGGALDREVGAVVSNGLPPPPPPVDGRASASRAPVDTADRDRTPNPGSRSATKPTHRIPLRDAGSTLYRAITTLESLAADRHNGADVVDYWLDQTGAHLDDIERHLAAAAQFLAEAQTVITQRRRAA